MSFINQATSKNTILTLFNPLFGGAPQILSGAMGTDDMFKPTDTENVNMEVGTDGGLNAWSYPVVIEGELTFLPNAAGLVPIRLIQNYQAQQAFGFVFSGVLVVTNPSLGSVLTYNNFVITSPFGGFGQGKKVDDVKVKFKSSIPTNDIIGNALSILNNALQLVGNL